MTVEVSETEADRLVDRARQMGRYIEHPELSIYGIGCAAVLELPRGLGDAAQCRQVEAQLRSIRADRSAAAGPIAIGALPFDPRARGELVVASLTLTVEPKNAALLTIVATDPSRALRRLASEPKTDGDRGGSGPGVVALSSTPTEGQFVTSVGEARDLIRSGAMQKVVLARAVEIVTSAPLSLRSITDHLRGAAPDQAVFCVDGFTGASPELLVQRRGAEVWSHPLAGTALAGSARSNLLADRKQLAEHAITVDAVAEVLRRFTTSLEVPTTPAVLELPTLVHLGSRCRGTLGHPAPGALELAGALHPTPAVAGAPRDAALSYLAAHEQLDRGRYAGAVGHVAANGDGRFFVGIRSAEIGGTRARCFAGVGIVAASEPELELEETTWKLQLLLDATLGRTSAHHTSRA